jgi:hypothetical protein
LALNVKGFQFIKDFEMEELNPKNPKEFENSFTSFLDLYSNELKKIKTFLFDKDQKDIWFNISGNKTVFIGNLTGNIAILYLSLNKKSKHHLHVQYESNNIIFEKFKDDNIKLKKSLI